MFFLVKFCGGSLIHECIKGTLGSIKDARANSNQQRPAPRDALNRSVRFSMKTPEETTAHQYDSDENERNMSPEPVKQCKMITLFFELIIVSNKGWHKGDICSYVFVNHTT